MKKIDFTQMGGFPLNQPTLDFMQDSYQETQQAFLDFVLQQQLYNRRRFSAYILTGIEEKIDGGVEMLTPGWIIRDGELLYFAGSTLEAASSGIGTQQVLHQVTFKDGSVNNVFNQKLAVAGGDNPLLLNNYGRIVSISDLRPILSRKIRREIPAIPAGSLTNIFLDVEHAKVGDVVVITATEVVQDGGGPAYPVFGWVSMDARVDIDAQVRVTIRNQHPSQAAFDGLVDFNIRILK